MPFEFEGEELQRCPVQMVTQQSLEYLYAYSFYKDRLLPVSGGWQEQAAKYLDAMQYIQNEINKIEEKQDL